MNDRPRVIFHGEGGETVVAYAPDEPLTVLELARRHGVPLHWRCGLGTCGTCAARVTVLDGEPRPLTGKERNVLAREGKLDPVASLQGAWRLCCGYLLGGESLRVEW